MTEQKFLDAIAAARAKYQPVPKAATILEHVGEHYWQLKAALADGVPPSVLAAELTSQGYECTGSTLQKYMGRLSKTYEHKPPKKSKHKRGKSPPAKQGSQGQPPPSESASPQSPPLASTTSVTAPAVPDISVLRDPFADRHQGSEITEAEIVD